MKRVLAFLLAAVMLFGLSACKKTVEEQDSGNTEADALLGTWTNPNGMEVVFSHQEDGSYVFTVTTPDYALSPNYGTYTVEDGILYLDGWFAQNDSEYAYDGQRLTMEINGCSFTLTREESDSQEGQTEFEDTAPVENS